MTFKKLTDEEKAARAAEKERLAAEKNEQDALLAADEAAPADDENPHNFTTELSEAEKKKITEHAAQKVRVQLKDAAKEKYLKAELDRLRLEAGVAKPSSLGGTHDELVTFSLDLGYEGNAFIQLNQPHGKCYFHGVTYTEPRHIFNTLNETAYNGAKLTKQVKGESVYRNRAYGTRISATQGVKHGALH